MISYKNIEQKSEEWFRLKWGKIGGTASNGLFNKTDTLAIDILSQRCEEYEHIEGFVSDDMARGNFLEPKAREYLEKLTNLTFEETGWLQSEENELLGISPDGITPDETVQCEIKCFGRKNHYKTLLEEEIPRENLAQVIHAFTVNPKLESLYWIAYRPESPSPFVQEVTRDTLFDMGWKLKREIPQVGTKGQPIKPKIVTEPDIKSVQQWSEIAIQSADELLAQILDMESKIKF